MPEPISEKLGGLPYLSMVWDFGPLSAAIVMILVDFGGVCFFMYLEGRPPWRRQLYKTFLWNDTIFIPLYMAMVVVILKDATVYPRFCTETWWHIAVFLFACMLAVLIEVFAVNSGQYTFNQQLSPSKLWHTAISGVVGYWLAAPLIPVLAVYELNWSGIGILVALVGSLYNVYRDVTTRPFPYDAHLEGTYIPWHWRPRQDAGS